MKISNSEYKKQVNLNESFNVKILSSENLININNDNNNDFNLNKCKKNADCLSANNKLNFKTIKNNNA